MSNSLTNFDITQVDENGIVMCVDTDLVSWLNNEVSDNGLQLKRADSQKSALVEEPTSTSGKQKRVRCSTFETHGNSNEKKVLRHHVVHDAKVKKVTAPKMSSTETNFDIKYVDENNISHIVDTDLVSWLNNGVTDNGLQLKCANSQKPALVDEPTSILGIHEGVENSNKKETVRNDVTVGVIAEPKVTNCGPDVDNDAQCNILLSMGFNLPPDVTITKRLKNSSTTTKPLRKSQLNAITGYHSESNLKQTEETKKLYTMRLKNNERYKSSPSYLKNRLSFLCQYCDLAFTNQLEHMKHEMCHDKVIPFTCHVCGFGYVSRKFLIEHITCVHMLFRPYICTLCNKGYSRRTSLRYHSLTHTDAMPFVCVTCNKKFATKSNMTKHLRLHSTNHSHICAKCPKSFATSAEFVAHVKTHITYPLQLNQIGSPLLNEYKLLMHEVTPILPPNIKNEMNLSLDGAHSIREQEDHSFSSLGRNGNDISEENLVGQLPQAYTCDVCDDKFQHECAFHKHLDFHLCSDSICKECGKTYNRLERRHIRNQNDANNSRNNSHK